MKFSKRDKLEKARRAGTPPSRNTAVHFMRVLRENDGPKEINPNMLNKNTVSPFFQPGISAEAFKDSLLKHLDILSMPSSLDEHDHGCERDCHIMERNHTINTIRRFVEGKGGDNSLDA